MCKKGATNMTVVDSYIVLVLVAVVVVVVVIAV